jgi:calcium permeable stress-gated cation channel
MSVCFCKVDATEFYTNEEARLNQQVEDEKQRALKKPLGVAFVTLVSVEAARRIYEDHTPSCKCAANSSSSSLSRQLQPHNWDVAFAPVPQDIYWQDQLPAL